MFEVTGKAKVEKIETLSDLRKAIKKIGYGLKTKQMSWGKHATYTQNESGLELTSNVFTKESRQTWAPLMEFLAENESSINRISEKEGVYGLMKG